MAKGKHKYNIGDIVTFKFLTGDVYTGKIIDETRKADGTPDYKIRVEEPGNKGNTNGFTIYPCMTEKRILRRDFTAIEVMKLTEKKKKIRTDKSKSQDLKEELNKQTNFLNGEIE